jgi:uncharacterized protein (TIGR04222 family)
VTAEYRRFLALACLRAEAACPPADVDLAWRAHAARPAEYARFCREALGRSPLRRPAPDAAGGTPQRRSQYTATLQAYRSAFGRRPPGDIWPGVEERFATGWRSRLPAFPPVQVPEMLAGRVVRVFAAVGAGLVLGLLWHASGSLLGGRGLPSKTFCLVFLVCTLVALAALHRFAADRPQGDGPGCAVDRIDAWEAAWLAGGARRMGVTAIVSLVQRGVLQFGEALSSGLGPPRPPLVRVPGADAKMLAHPVECAVVRAAAEGTLRLGHARDAVALLAEEIQARLVAAGLASDAGTLQPRRTLALLVGVLLLALASGNWQSLARAGHEAWPMAMAAIAAGVHVAWQARLVAGISERGAACLNRARLGARPVRAAGLAHPERGADPARDAAAFAMAVAVLGPVAVTGDERYGWLEKAFQPLATLTWADATGPRRDGGGFGRSGFDLDDAVDAFSDAVDFSSNAVDLSSD